MKIILFAAILLFPALVMAQDEGVDSSLGCAEVLAAPPFVDMLTRNEGRDFQDLSPLSSGQALLGLECSVGDLTEFFENADWEFLGYEEQRLGGPLGGHGGIPEYYVDASASFCLKRPTIFGMFGFRCRPRATILFLKGQVSHIIAYVSK